MNVLKTLCGIRLEADLTVLVAVAGVLALLVAIPLRARQDGREVFERARMLEEINQSLPEAIQLYEQVAARAAENPALAAQAQLRVGLLYERLGRTAEAQQAFELVLTRHANQQGIVAEARTRLASLPSPVSGQSSQSARLVWGGAGTLVDDGGSPSPDGRYLSFTDWLTGDLAIRDVSARAQRRLTAQTSAFAEGYAAESRVSPDGTKVAFTWLKNLSRERRVDVELRVIGIDGSQPRVLYVNPEVEYLKPTDWSPDGKHILAALTTRNRAVQIALLSTADGSASVLKTLPWGSLGRMSISPDGRYIAYDFQPKEDSPSRSIMLLSTDGRREITLSENPSREEVFGWSPHGNAILFASDRTGTRELWAMPIAEGKVQGPPELIRRDIGRIEPMGVTRKGALYYSVPVGTSDVYTASWDWESGSLLAASAATGQRLLGVNRAPGWSPDGQFLAYISQPGGPRGAQQLITVLSVQTGEERQLSPKLSGIFSGTYWSPDGRSLLIVGFDLQKRRGVYAIDAQTGEARVLVQDRDGQTFFNPEWLPDGKAIVYFRRDDAPRTSSLVVRELESGRERELPGTETAGSSKSLSPDGHRIAFVAQDDSIGKLKVVPVAGGAPRELFRVDDVSGRINLVGWTPNSSQVIFKTSRLQNVNEEMWRIPVEGGERYRLLWRGAPAHFAALGTVQGGPVRFHPDGRRMAFAAGQGTTEIWVMENLFPTLSVSR